MYALYCTFQFPNHSNYIRTMKAFRVIIITVNCDCFIARIISKLSHLIHEEKKNWNYWPISVGFCLYIICISQLLSKLLSFDALLHHLKWKIDIRRSLVTDFATFLSFVYPLLVPLRQMYRSKLKDGAMFRCNENNLIISMKAILLTFVGSMICGPLNLMVLMATNHVRHVEKYAFRLDLFMRFH